MGRKIESKESGIADWVKGQVRKVATVGQRVLHVGLKTTAVVGLVVAAVGFYSALYVPGAQVPGAIATAGGTAAAYVANKAADAVGPDEPRPTVNDRLQKVLDADEAPSAGGNTQAFDDAGETTGRMESRSVEAEGYQFRDGR